MNIKELLNRQLKIVFNQLGYDNSYANVGFSNLPEISDFQCNAAFILAKKYKRQPNIICDEIASECNKKIKGFTFTSISGYLNISLNNTKLTKIANKIFKDENIGISKHKTSNCILMDYGGANIAKELHVGHLRSPIIGESLKRLFVLMGDKVISDTHLGDWGLQIGLILAGLEEGGYLDYYFKKSVIKKEITLKLLNSEYPKASKRKDIDEKFKKKAELYTLYIQQKKEPYYTIYKEIRKESVKKIKQLYGNLNTYFDLWYGESNSEPYIDKTINIFINKSLTRESEGAMVVDIAKEGEHVPLPKKNILDKNEPQLYKNPMPPAILKKYNGAALYVTTDIATIFMRNKKFMLNEIIYLTDNRQSTHFEQVFRCAKLANISPKDQKLTFIPFGTMKGKDGKAFKTREGGVINLEDVVSLLFEKANEKLQANGVKNPKKLALKIGVAAMKFGDLCNIVTNDYVFDIDKFLMFEGKTGPYLQYTYARISSILNRAKDSYNKIIIQNKFERDILMNILKLIESYEICYKDRSLHTLCNCVYNLASSYSTLYNSVRILSEKDIEKRKSLLSLSKLTQLHIKQALDVLSIDIVTKM